jgi:2-polyprenyl-3-methyl-5-hydroxy-6-metoxy-1,4-benzoquinol methylase
MVQVTTPEIKARFERIQTLDFDYPAQSKQYVQACNLCGDSSFTVLTRRDRYGYAAESHQCQRCGLVFLNPVMTIPAYQAFYQDIYRPLVSAYHNRLINAGTLQAEQRDYAGQLAVLLRPFLQKDAPVTLLDIGGSTGVVAHHLSRQFSLQATILDPAPLEVAVADKLGLETILSLLEDYEPSGESQYNIVLLCQTVDHLLDIRTALEKIRRLILPEGLFFVDIVDFESVYRQNQSIESAIKIDHPFYLTEETIKAYLTRAGFDVLQASSAPDQIHKRYICVPGDANPNYLPLTENVEKLTREIAQVQGLT